MAKDDRHSIGTLIQLSASIEWKIFHCEESWFLYLLRYKKRQKNG